jgi:hypothetical protein
VGILDAIEAAAWEGFRRSCGPRRPGAPLRQGDPRFQARAFQWVRTRLCVIGAFNLPDANGNSAQVVQLDWAGVHRHMTTEVDTVEERPEEREARVIAKQAALGQAVVRPPIGPKELPNVEPADIVSPDYAYPSPGGVGR